jgi:streptogramin lyase
MIASPRQSVRRKRSHDSKRKDPAEGIRHRSLLRCSALSCVSARPRMPCRAALAWMGCRCAARGHPRRRRRGDVSSAQQNVAAVMHISIGSTNGRIAAMVLLVLLAACGGQADVVPSRDLIQGPGRIVSSAIDAGGRTYTVDEIYTPSENNLAGIAAGPDDDIWFTGDYPLVAKSSIRSDIIEYPISTYGNAGSIVEGPDHNVWVTLYPGAIGKVLASGRLTAFPIADKFGGSRSSPDSITTGPDKDLWFAVSSSRSYIVRTDITGKMQGYRMPAGSRVQSLASGSDGNLWFTDSGSNKIGRMTATGARADFRGNAAKQRSVIHLYHAALRSAMTLSLRFSSSA